MDAAQHIEGQEKRFGFSKLKQIFKTSLIPILIIFAIIAVAITYTHNQNRVSALFNDISSNSEKIQPPSHDTKIMRNVEKALNAAYNAKFKAVSVDHQAKYAHVYGIVPVHVKVGDGVKAVDRLVFASSDGNAVIPGIVLNEAGIPIGMTQAEYNKAKQNASKIAANRRRQAPANVNYDATVMFDGKSVTNESMWKDFLAHTSYITDGKGKRFVYMFFDPLSEHCRKLYHESRTLIAADSLAIRWIPLPHVSEKSKKYAEWIIKKGDSGSLRSMMDDPSKINVDSITGSSGKGSAYSRNMKLAEFMMGNKIATPTVVFRASGKTRVVVGATGAMLQQISRLDAKKG